MTKLNKILPLLVCLPLSALAATQHDNYFCPSSGSIDFIPDMDNPYRITSSQKSTWGGVSGMRNKKNLALPVKCLLVKAGRKSDSSDHYSVINWVRELAANIPDNEGSSVSTTNAKIEINRYSVLTTRDSGMYIQPIYPEDPNYTINFAIYGTLIITDKKNDTYQCPHTIIYQGNSLKSPGIGMNVWSVVKNNSKLGERRPHLICQDANGKDHVFALHQVKSHENPERINVNDADEEYIMSFVREDE